MRMGTATDRSPRKEREPGSLSNGFTLVELLVTVTVIGVLASLLMPGLAGAKERAKAAKAKAELYGLGMALEMYTADHEDVPPPVRINCNTDMLDHWCQLPIELSAQGYLPKSDQGGREANLEDVFNPGHTYKYAAPGPQFLNDAPGANFQLWVPDTFPNLDSEEGSYFNELKKSPVRWVVWSLGPRPESRKSQSSYAPMSSTTWYRRVGDGGVIARFADREGTQFSSP